MKIRTFFLVGVFLGTTGCAGMDRMGTKLDMAAAHMESRPPVYEGQIRSVKRVGAMTSLSFTDGKIMDVSKAPVALLSGDVVRIYQDDKGYEAHLWHSAESSPSAEASALAPALPPAK